MARRGDKLEKFKSPGICYYEPKYSQQEKKQYIIPFEVKVNLNDPKYKIQKLWRSYNVQTDYQIVNFKK